MARKKKGSAMPGTGASKKPGAMPKKVNGSMGGGKAAGKRGGCK